MKRPSARTGKTEIISNDLGHIMKGKHRSSSSPWGAFLGTWQTTRKPIQLLTRSKKFEGAGTTKTTQNTSSVKNALVAPTGDVEGANTDASKMNAPVHPPSQVKETEPTKAEPIDTPKPSSAKITGVTPLNCRPESHKTV